MYKQGRQKGIVRFSVPAHEGPERAFLAGDFTDWEPVPMRKQKGVFAVTVPVAKGTHQYKFIVDGRWITDPENSDWAANGLGSMNSVAMI